MICRPPIADSRSVASYRISKNGILKCNNWTIIAAIGCVNSAKNAWNLPSSRREARAEGIGQQAQEDRFLEKSHNNA
jgi:hypothetical protein